MSSHGPDSPLISICVPTHHGRREPLEALLRGALEQAGGLPGQIEICVSDNASRDATSELIEELRRWAPCVLRYRRHGEDQGLARNLLAAMELASGRYCWLLGSDDLLMDGGLGRACELLRELPGAAGYAVGAVHVDALDPGLRSRALPRAFHPPGECSRLIEGLDRVYEECGNSWCALSWTIVEREAWLRAARAKTAVALAHPIFPQVIVLGAVAAERPCWGWLAEPLVRQRNATTFLFEGSTIPLAIRWSRIIGAVASAWASVLGNRVGRRHRRRMRRLAQVWGGAADVRASKLYERPPTLVQARMALTYLTAFWAVRDYWLRVMPLTLAPGRAVRRRYADVSRVAAAAAALVLEGRLASDLRAGLVQSVRIQAINAGSTTLLTDGPRSATIGQRWSTLDGRLLDASELAINHLAELPQSLPRALRPGHSTTVDLALYLPPRPGVYQVELAGHQHGRGWLEGDGLSRTLKAVVEVGSGQPAGSEASSLSPGDAGPSL